MIPSLPNANDLNQNQKLIYNNPFQNRCLIKWGPWTWKSTLLWLMSQDYINIQNHKGKNPNIQVLTYLNNLKHLTNQLFWISCKSAYSFILSEENLGKYAKWIWSINWKKLWSDITYAKEIFDKLYNWILDYSKTHWSPINKESFVLIDEWQDLPIHFYKILSLLYERIYVFMDEDQTISIDKNKLYYSTEKELIDVLDLLPTQIHHLTENHRNTKEIFEVALMLPWKSNNTWKNFIINRIWFKPIFWKWILEKQQEYCLEIIKKNSGQNIAFIFDTTDNQNKFSLYLKEKWINHQNCHSDNENSKYIDYTNNNIFILNYNNIKWLEFDKVIMMDSWNVKKIMENNAYVAITRPKSELICLSQSYNLVWWIIPNENIFNYVDLNSFESTNSAANKSSKTNIEDIAF